MVQRALLVALVASACSPYGAGSFTCENNEECGAGGTCSDGFCAFVDNLCPSGLRYGDRSGPLSNQCVGGQSDGGVETIGDGSLCYGTGLVVACFTAPPMGMQTLASNVSVNTESSPQCQTVANSTDWCVIAAQSITINAGVTVAATGARPLVLIATETLTVNGSIDVASHRNANVGPAADAPGCNAGGAPTGTSGGAGGSFGGVGGNGAGINGNAGMAGAALTPTTLRGGCSGQVGANDGSAGGARGRGGGAVYLIANTSIFVGGLINASGSGGGGGGTGESAGGGGGGAGGFIGLDSPMIMVSGVAVANGGGGGEASGTLSTGEAGDDPTNPTMPALGGAGMSGFGTDGGNGAFTTTLNGANASTSCGTCGAPSAGGGGGGGAGIIKRYRASSIGGTGVVSPPAT